MESGASLFALIAAPKLTTSKQNAVSKDALDAQNRLLVHAVESGYRCASQNQARGFCATLVWVGIQIEMLPLRPSVVKSRASRQNAGISRTETPSFHGESWTSGRTTVASADATMGLPVGTSAVCLHAASFISLEPI